MANSNKAFLPHWKGRDPPREKSNGHIQPVKGAKSLPAKSTPLLQSQPQPHPQLHKWATTTSHAPYPLPKNSCQPQFQKVPTFWNIHHHLQYPPHQSHRLSQQTWIPASQNWKKSVGSWRTAGRKTLNARICWGQLQSWRRKRWQYLQTIAQRPDSSNVQERQEIPPTHSHTPRPGLKRLPQGMKSKWIAKIGIKGNKSCSTPHVTCLLWRCTHCPWFCPFTLAPKMPWYPQHMMDLKATPLRTGEVF